MGLEIQPHFVGSCTDEEVGTEPPCWLSHLAYALSHGHDHIQFVPFRRQSRTLKFERLQQTILGYRSASRHVRQNWCHK